jgi:hypothetical protein
MSENTTNKNVSNDEIDLLDLFRRMGRTLNGWLNSLGRAFLIATVFLLKFSSDSSFSSDLIIRNNVITNSDMISYIGRLHRYYVENNTLALSNALPIPPKQLNNILDIDAFWIIDKGNDGIPDYVDYLNKASAGDTLNVRMPDRLNIRVRIKSPQELDLVKTCIIDYIEKDSLFQQRNRVRVRQNEEMLSRLTYDIEQLDSLQKFKYFEETKNRLPKNGQQMIFLQEQKTQLMYTDIQTLFARKQTLEAERELYKGIITVLSDFSLPSRRENGGLFYSKKVMPLFLIITILLLVIHSNWKKITDIFLKY